MSGFRQILDVPFSDLSSGILIANIPEQGDPDGVGPNDITIFVVAKNLPPSNPGITMFTYPGPVFGSGTSSAGEISVESFFINQGDDKIYDGSALISFDNGFFQASIVAFLNHSDVGVLADITIVYNPTDISGYTPTLTDDPFNLTLIDSNIDIDNTATATFSFDYDNSSLEDPIGFAINRDGVVVGSIPWTNGTTTYQYTDVIFNASGSYDYTVYAYIYADVAISDPTSPLTVDFGAAPTDPDIDLVGSGGFALGGSATFVFSADPSGLYTLVPNKTNDTLYDRTTPGATTNVKIPDPFIKTGFIGG